MNHRFALFLVVAASALIGTSANTRCYKIVGNVTCSLKPFNRPVEIQLIDEDGLPWETDDLMGRTWATRDGSFKIEGCGNDFGQWNDPDPYLKFIHTCTKNHGYAGEKGPFVQSKMLVSESYLPHVITLENVDLHSLEVIE
ncbi:hypothetical protein QR680_017703 [Steinernema hermaphroditum]|uniref:Uncharacterized protein n=1 Tax=Steinernema hermaphroditum TaxID=289476 RepID=A0AA39HG65_9BILA|nr:hypothetical protein QR680_017703 [Steinernema hermaphroditum]